jgi:hypothetical protein
LECGDPITAFKQDVRVGFKERTDMKIQVWMMSVLLAVAAVAQELAAPAVEEDGSKTNAAMDRIAELLKVGSDPFRFGYQEGGAGSGSQTLIPVDVSQLAIGSVQVKGILWIEGDEPCALVQVGSSKQIQLVRENDLILMPSSSTARSGHVQSQAATETTYLLVTKILKDSLLVAPKKSPETTITIR